MSNLKWQERVVQTKEIHQANLRANDGKWTIMQTANQLRRSYGRVNEDLLLASWLITHGVQLEKIESIEEALEFVRCKRKELKYR